MPETARGILMVLRVLPDVGRARTWTLGVCIVLTAGLPIVIAVLTGLLIGQIVSAAEAGPASAEAGAAITTLIAIGVLVVVERAIGPIMAATASTLGRDLDRYLQERVLSAVNRPGGIAHLEDPDVQDEIRIVRGLGMSAYRPSQTVEALPQVLSDWLRALGSAAVLFAFQWWLGLLWLVLWPVVVYRMQRDYARIGQEGYKQSTELRRAEYTRDLALNTPTAKEVRVWGMLDWLISRFDSTWRAAITPVREARRPRPATVLGSSGTILAINALSYGLLGWAAVRGDLELGALAVFVQALIGANSYALGDEHFYLSYASVTVPKLLTLERRLLQNRPREPRAALTAVADTAPREGIRFEQVTFRYPRAEREVLSGLDLDIEAGRSLAIVGENGAGKTTLVKLLSGLYEPTQGRITMDGADLAALDPAQWRRQVAVLFQDFARYHLPVRDNIGLGAPEHAGDLDKMRLAADRAGALDVIEALPHGWDTVLSREYENGVDLSGGQWQRIALARAMFAVEAGARVLVLDEPTAALDVRAEADLYERFLELTEGLTTCLISHRFSTVRRAERIVVLRDGVVAEDGGHEELLELGGHYSYMFNLQAERFRTDSVVSGEGGTDA
ncbi:ABC transporter ATP-binding protein [Nonomuraea lactucae]|uniref:ABC transporter ATP-binding protein n=1 Tax=Nonomuraea lactucae TaxID=2249762 RepID=UPI0013B44723|nr:ABC transporter ATP-binding protein [Nonomuraea lactucae]